MGRTGGRAVGAAGITLGADRQEGRRVGPANNVVVFPGPGGYGRDAAEAGADPPACSTPVWQATPVPPSPQ